MAAVDILLGLQWGDEGKGKVVDFLAPKYNVVARFQGGPNAGHTLEFDGHKHVLHQIPSGIFHEGILNVIGNGVVLDPITFKKEIEGLAPFNLDLKRHLVISNKTQMIIPTHRMLDKAYEIAKGDKKIGSTLRGIGPTYQDKAARKGLRIGDINEPDFDERYRQLRDFHLQILERYNFEAVLEEEEKQFFEAIETVREFDILSTEYLINQALVDGQSVLAEGAQGSLLDIDFGSYPYVTSSNTIAAGACTGLGVAPGKIGEVYGIFKAYCTRVGSGPFPTELHGDDGEELRKLGNEFGATTGRPRRCGWLDLPALKYTCMLNGVTQLFMMKADVLADMDEIKICHSYKVGDEATEELPLYLDGQENNLVFDSFKGWKENNIESFESLPATLAEYVKYIENSTQTPISLISLGPDRTQTLMKEKISQ
ncbi:adenylosuccinate synthase [Marinoscillum furvescens]|uniref:Adenylosuccinate synthetase n=1 Tax=Marinoscillum furvescens DSM 4134 TaxID=1122208 RepID=A0A3D9KZM8_MARFU|nr:adenylosuccinate synthase [Marinoscillum furvescens]RED92615.1 adenylosuccinate synthetase [Marinoscillum furvescens DSM 4134]